MQSAFSKYVQDIKKEEINYEEILTAKDFSLIPDGYYVAIIEKAAFEESDSGTRVKLTFLLTKGQFKGRKLWKSCYLNLKLDPFMTESGPEQTEKNKRKIKQGKQFLKMVSIATKKDLSILEDVCKIQVVLRVASYDTKNSDNDRGIINYVQAVVPASDKYIQSAQETNNLIKENELKADEEKPFDDDLPF